MSKKKQDTTIPMNERYPRTVSVEIFDAWQLLRRKGDPEAIRKVARCSRPKADLALKYGHVIDTKLVNAINKFFNDRMLKEKRTGVTLLSEAIN